MRSDLNPLHILAERCATARPVEPLIDADTEPAGPCCYHIWTLSGSRYVIRHDAVGIWWLSSPYHTRAPFSRSLADGEFEIATPYVVLGESALLLAPPHLALGDPRRVPGGGTVTTPVVRVERVSLDAPAPAPLEDVVLAELAAIADRMTASPPCAPPEHTAPTADAALANAAPAVDAKPGHRQRSADA